MSKAGGALTGLLALVVGSRIAGNPRILAAPSHVMIYFRGAEQEGYPLSFRNFAWIGVTLTTLSTLLNVVYLDWGWGR